ncbi:hypothetical protein [Microbulbifer taiwanensis]|uniref:hypothetical protein n=1 Tax=Microbulbifer taiwanensis TaxID=986746 RepID=UPI0036217388
MLDESGEALAQVTLGQFNDSVYLLLTVADHTPAYQDPRTGLLASGDAIEIHTADRHYTLPVASQGSARALWHNLRRSNHERNCACAAAGPHRRAATSWNWSCPTR